VLRKALACNTHLISEASSAIFEENHSHFDFCELAYVLVIGSLLSIFMPFESIDIKLPRGGIAIAVHDRELHLSRSDIMLFYAF